MIDRRRFLQILAVAASTPATVMSRENGNGGFGALKPDPGELLDLPAGFSYTVISTAGEEMDDGLLVPGRHDGMAAFPAEDGTLRLVCNHELRASWRQLGGFGSELERLDKLDYGRLYDAGKGVTPCIGGTTTIHYDPATRERRRIHLSLAGTEINCAGGAMPWGSWLSCEETFADPGTSFERGTVIHREQRHGYVFEVPRNRRRAGGSGSADCDGQVRTRSGGDRSGHRHHLHDGGPSPKPALSFPA